MSKLAAFLGSNAGPVLGAGVFAVGAIGAGAYFGVLAPDDAPEAVPQTVAQPAEEKPEVAVAVAEPEAKPEPEPEVKPEPEAKPEPTVEAEADADPAPVADETPEVVVEEAPEVVVEQAPEVVAENTPEPEAEPAPEVAEALPRAPSIDEVRSEADGLTVLAGRGEPNGTVTLFVDNVENTSVQVGRDGTFAIIAFLDPAPKARVLSVVQRVGDIELVAADIILAPRVVVAEAEVEVEAAPEPAPTQEETVVAEAEVAAVPEPKPETAQQSEPEPAVAAESASASESEPEIVAESAPEQESVPTPEATEEVASEPKPEPEPVEVAEAAQPAPLDEVVAAVEPVDEAKPVETVKEETEATATEDVATAEATPVQEAEPKAEPAPEPSQTEVAILKSDEEGVEVINRSSAPEVMSNVEIDTISYSDEGDVLLSGRAQSIATTVRVYLNNAPVTTLDVDTSGRWRGDLPDVDTGIYTLRIDEVDSEGEVTSRVETPFKREAPEVLAAAGGSADAPAKAITVQKGATLWAIARDRYGDGTLYVRVFDANSDAIRDPDLIYPGQVFDLPE